MDKPTVGTVQFEAKSLTDMQMVGMMYQGIVTHDILMQPMRVSVRQRIINGLRWLLYQIEGDTED